MSQNTPKHLRHIDKTTKETKKVISNLGNKDKFGNREVSLSKRKLEKNEAVNDKLKDEMDIFLHRLQQPYCSYRDENKIWLKKKLAGLRKTDPKAFYFEIQKELKKLDALEKQYEKRQSLREDKARKRKFHKNRVAILEKIKFWFFRLRQSDLYSGDKPSIYTLNAIEIDYKNRYEKIRSIVDLIVYTKFSQDFFDYDDPNKAQYSTYNMLALLCGNSMGKAMTNITMSLEDLHDIKGKVNELKDFSIIYLTLVDNAKFKKQLFEDIDILIKIAIDFKKLKPISKLKPMLIASNLKVLKKELEILLDKGNYFPKLQAIYSSFFGYMINMHELKLYLNVEHDNIEDSPLLPPQAERNCQKWKKKLEADIKYNQISLDKVVQMHEEVALGDVFAQNSLANCPPSDIVDHENYPLLFLNRIISDFLDIFEDLITGRSQVILEDIEEDSIPLFKEVGDHLEKEIRQLLIQHDFSRKIRKDDNQNIKQFQLNLFDDKTNTYKNFSNTVDYIKKQNGNIYFQFMRMFERELNSRISHPLNILEKKLLNKNVLRSIKNIYSLDKTIRQEQKNKQLQGCLSAVNKRGQKKEFSPDSLYALLKFGQAMMCYFANYVGELTVKNLISSKSFKEIQIDELKSQLMLFSNFE